MKTELKISLRYLFSKKRHSAINIVSWICSGGVCVATVALVCILSVYNGFQSLVSELYSSFDSDLKITPSEGKTFCDTFPEILQLRSIPEIETMSIGLEDGAVAMCEEQQLSVRLKGIDNEYYKMTDLQNVVYAGKFDVGTEDNPTAVIGMAIAAQLDADIHYVKPVRLFAPIHDSKVNMANPEGAFNEISLFISGLYSTGQQDIDSRFVFVPLSLAKEMYGYDEHECGMIELKFKKNTDITSSRSKIEHILSSYGRSYKTEDRIEQHSDFYRMLRVEKWITFLILAFVLSIAVVNIISSLTMLIIEKQDDMRTLKCLGASDNMIRRIFVIEGWLVSAIGCIFGVVLGLVLCAVQHFFGVIKLSEGNNFVTSVYPVEVHIVDILIIILTVLAIGLLVAWYPSRLAVSDERDN